MCLEDYWVVIVEDCGDMYNARANVFKREQALLDINFERVPDHNSFVFYVDLCG